MTSRSEGGYTPTPPILGNSTARRPQTHRELRSARKAELAASAEFIATTHQKPQNIHRETLPRYVPETTQDLVEKCYLKKEQHGWAPLGNVDPGYDVENDHPSFPYWWEFKDNHNKEGVNKFKGSPRLYNYEKRLKAKETPLRADTTRGGLEGRTPGEKVVKVMQDKITNVDSAVGRPGWRAHVTLGNGVVRWTDDVFDWQCSNQLTPSEVNEAGKSLNLFPKELEPMYSSFSPDKVFHWKKPTLRKKVKKKKKLTTEEIVRQADLRRKHMEFHGSIHGSRPLKHAITEEAEECEAPTSREKVVRTSLEVTDSVSGAIQLRTPKKFVQSTPNPEVQEMVQAVSKGPDTLTSSITGPSYESAEAMSVPAKVEEDANTIVSASDLSVLSIRSGGFDSPKTPKK